MHLLVTNDFPPKVGGIQSYLWELWRRLPPEEFVVLTTAHPDAPAFDAAQPFRVERVASSVLLPTPALIRRIDRLAAEVGASFVILDPALPLGALGPRLALPYLVVGHGAEITVPGRVPGSRQALAGVLRGCRASVAAGGYVAEEMRRAAGRSIEVLVVPPGVDVERFRPLPAGERPAARRALGLPDHGPLIVNVGRLVPRKGTDVLIDSLSRLQKRYPDLTLAVAGTGRQQESLERQAARRRAPVRFRGRVAEEALSRLYGCGDVFAAPNRTRWAGLEQEGFGIVFLEAAACGLPQVAGESGGAPEAVADGETGFLVGRPEDPEAVADALGRLLDDPQLRARMGERSRERAEAAFSYPVLAARLHDYLAGLGSSAPGHPNSY